MSCNHYRLDGNVSIDSSMCTGCGLCAVRLCPVHAIGNGRVKGAGMMNKNIVLCGVGGQGTVLASKLLAAAAMETEYSGYECRNDRYGAAWRKCIQPRAYG